MKLPEQTYIPRKDKFRPSLTGVFPWKQRHPGMKDSAAPPPAADPPATPPLIALGLHTCWVHHHDQYQLS